MKSRGIYWPAAQNTVVQKILRRARHNVHVIFIPGNHDEAAREHAGVAFGNIQVEQEYVHMAADGKRHLLLHGDLFDGVTKYHRWLAILGDHAYSFVVRLNVLLSWFRRTLGLTGYWSLSGYAKRKVKGAVNFIHNFERAVLYYVKGRGVDGVTCGHIHSAALRQTDGLMYINCGDWVDSCTAILEHTDGRMELVRWDTATVVPGAAETDSPEGPVRVA